MNTASATGVRAWHPRSVEELIADPRSRGLLIAASKDPDAKITFLVTPPDQPDGQDRVAVKVPATEAAGAAVEAEGRMLVGLRRLQLGDVGATIPRYVETMRLGPRPVLVSTAMTGTPMSVPYHQWFHTARPAAVRGDFTVAGGWLREFQDTTSGTVSRVTWVREVEDGLRGRWDGHPSLSAALANLTMPGQRLGERSTPRTAVHGDFWFGNLLVRDGRLSGVIDWEHGTLDGCPLRDLARFALSYCLYIDRHTRPGHRVLGHRTLRREGFGTGVRHGLLARGFLPDLVRTFLAEGLVRLGLPRSDWYDVALTGIAEVAASANDADFAAAHLELLAALPARPRRHRP